MKFSILISIYNKENPEYLACALKSIWENQTIKASEIIIVKDGILTEELDIIIDEFSIIAPTKIIKLQTNQGLGNALNIGIRYCNYEIVARMDSDDIAKPDRFEKQVNFLISHPEYDVVGSNIAEFNDSIDEIVSHRNVPERSDDISFFAKRRNPMNHMSIVFRKSAIINAGNYIPFLGYEDYYLWVRLLKNGSKFYNFQENLIYARIGNNMLVRRQGWKFFIQELKLQKKFYEIGLLNTFDYIINLILRATPRLFPVWGLKYVYKTLRK